MAEWKDLVGQTITAVETTRTTIIFRTADKAWRMFSKKQDDEDFEYWLRHAPCRCSCEDVLFGRPIAEARVTEHVYANDKEVAFWLETDIGHLTWSWSCDFGFPATDVMFEEISE